MRMPLSAAYVRPHPAKYTGREQFYPISRIVRPPRARGIEHRALLLSRRAKAHMGSLAPGFRCTVEPRLCWLSVTGGPIGAGTSLLGEPMKHAGPGTLSRIRFLLGELRARDHLREMRPGVFYLKSRAFLHFHDDPSGVFADVRLGQEFVRFPVTSRSDQSDLLDQIDERLSSISSPATDKRRRRTE